MKKITASLLALILLLGLTACGGSQPAADTATLTDPSGAEIALPDEVNTIVTLAPSIAEMVTVLGYGDKIVGYDTQSVGLEGLDPDAPVFDMVTPDMEQLAALGPDLLLVSNMSLYDQESPYQQLIDLGVCVACIPNAESIDEIRSDIRFVAALLDAAAEGEAVVAALQASLDEIAAIGETITDKKTVYFEISAAPYMYSFGSDVYLNEMIQLIGAENILAGESGWLSVEAETVVNADPDVILTNVNYLDDPVGEILSRDGWAGMSAVANEQVYTIDNGASSLPDQNIVKALEQMALAVYPEYYGG